MKEEICRDQIIEMYQKTRSGGNIAKELGITNYRVYKCLRQAGFDIKPRGPEKYPLEVIVEMYKSGKSTNVIAKELGLSSASVWERLNKRGMIRSRVETMEMSGWIKIKRSDYPKVIRMYQDGMSSMDIAKKFGLTYKDSVLKILRDNGVERRSMYGKNNPSWKGGITPAHKLIRNSETYNEFRKEIISERGHVCEITGRKDLPLNIHHKKPFARLLRDFISVYGASTKDRDLFYTHVKYFKPFWDKDNIIVMAEIVHKAIHRGVDIYKKNYYEMVEEMQKRYGSKKCQRCGTKFEPKVSQTNYGKRKSTAKYCEKCSGSRKDSMKDKTKEELLAHRKNKRSFNSAVLEHMRDVYRNSGKLYECYLCGYSPSLEIKRVKSIDDFSDTALFSEINDIDNIVCLCPNHAREFRNNCLSKSDLYRIKNRESNKI